MVRRGVEKGVGGRREEERTGDKWRGEKRREEERRGEEISGEQE